MAVSLIHFSFGTNRYYRSSAQCKWGDKIEISDELLPLLKLRSTMNNGANDVLLMNTYGSSCFKWSLLPSGSGNKASYHQRGQMRRFNVYTGFYSAIGYMNPEYENSKYSVSGSTIPWDVKCESYDIFMLGVIKKPYRYDIQNQTYQRTLSVREKDVVLLLNEEKFVKNDKFVKANYTTTIRTYLKQFVKQVKESGLVEIRVVSDEYLNNFIKQGVDLNVTSVVQLMKVQKEAVDNIFSILKPELIIV